jgi:hypothetical protein
MRVKYWPVPARFIVPSEEDPYSAETGTFAPEAVCGSAREFTNETLDVPLGEY